MFQVMLRGAQTECALRAVRATLAFGSLPCKLVWQEVVAS